MNKIDKIYRRQKINTYFKAHRTTLMMLAILLVMVIPLIIANTTHPKVSDSLKDLGISGMKIKEFDIDGNKFDKIKEEKNNIEVSSEYFDKGKGIVKQDIWIKNKENKKKTIDFSTTIEIDYQRVMFGGRNYILSENPITFNSYYNKEGQLIVPNIFMGEENKRINFKDVAKQGGYALAYESEGKYYIDLKIDNLNLNALEEYYIDPLFVNATDGFNLLLIGSDTPRGVATNGSDHWIVDPTDIFIYHTDGLGNNQTDGFNPSSIGCGNPYGITTNGTDHWITDNVDLFVYHTDILGNNITNGFHISPHGSSTPYGITTNGTDLWVSDIADLFVYHTDILGNNQTDGFHVIPLGSNNPYGITTNGTDFWISDDSDNFMYHTDILGNNITDGFDISVIGSNNPRDIATNGSDFWIVDPTDVFIYHLEPTNNIITLNFPLDNFETIESNITFNCSASGDRIHNISLYHNISGAFILNQTYDVSAGEPSSVNITFDVSNIIYGTHGWNCKAEDSTLYSFWGTNRTFIRTPFIEVSQTYNRTSYETKSETFIVNITYNSTLFNLGVSTILNYNGSDYYGTDISSGDYHSFKRTLDIPLVNFTQNKTFYWKILLSNSSGTFHYNLSSYNQTISNISLYTSGCVDGTNLSLNFSSYNEEDLTGLADFAFYGTFEYWLGSGNIKKTLSTSNSTLIPIPKNNLICINPNNLTYYSNAQIQYEKTGFVKRTHYLINASLTNTTQEMGLYLLNTSFSTSFIMNVINEVRVPIKDAYIYVQRYYPGTGEYHTVEMSKTDRSGNTIAHFEAETEDYKIIIFKGGVILYESDKAKIFCGETPCTLNFQTEATPPTTWTNVGNVSNLIWSLIYNETLKTYEYSYVDTTGSTSYGRLLVYISDKSPPNIICNESDTSSAATIICNVTLYDGTIYAEAFISRSPEILVWITSIVNKAVKAIFGMEGLFLAVIILMVIAMIGLWNPAVGVIMLIAGMISINLLHLASFGTVTVMGIAVIGIIILWEMKK